MELALRAIFINYDYKIESPYVCERKKYFFLEREKIFEMK